MFDFPSPPDELLEELKAKHGENLRIIEDGERMFVLAKPENPRGHLERMTTLASNDKKKVEAAEGLVKASVVYPDKDTMKKVLADEPGLAFALADPAMELLGVRQLSVKK